MKETNKEVIYSSLEDIMEEGYGKYAKYIIQDRALPDVRDGLKPVQRRILYMMYHDKSFASNPYKKSAKTVGDVMGNLHPHGDSSIYEALVNMSQDFKNNQCLIDMQGNNGSIDGDKAAAMRYTESRLMPISEYLLKDITEDTVEFKANYSDTMLEPLVLPTRFCNILVNGSLGIASGYATDIPPYNFNEVMEASIYRLLHPNCTFDEITQIINGPDFPTGAIIEGKKDIESMMKTGKGRFLMRAKVDIVKAKNKQQLIVSEIPFGIKKAELVKKISDVQENKDLDDILEVRDESDRNGLKIVIDVKANVDAQNILNVLYKETDLQTYYNANMVAIKDNRPQQLGIIAMLDGFLQFRQEVVYRRSQRRLAKANQRLHIIEGLIKAISILDEIIQTIRASKNRADSKQNLMEQFQFSEAQAEAIVTLQLYRLSNTDISQLKEEFAILINDIEFLKQMLAHQDILNNEIVKEFRELLAQFTQERKTEIKAEVAALEIDTKQLVSEEKVMVTISKNGYLKKVSLRSMNASDQPITTLRQNDELIGQIEASNLQQILCITNLGQYFVYDIHKLEEAKWKEVGYHFSSFISNSMNQEQIIACYLLTNFNQPYQITLISQQGKIKTTLLQDFEIKQAKMSRAMKLLDNDQLVSSYASLINEGNYVTLLTQQGYLACYPQSEISVTGLNAQGVKAMNLAKDDRIISGCKYYLNEPLVIIAHLGLAKRLNGSDISVSQRPSKGILITKKNKSQPYQMLQVVSGPLNYPLLINNEMTMAIKDFKLMSRTQSFSRQFEQESFINQQIVELVELEAKEQLQWTL